MTKACGKGKASRPGSARRIAPAPPAAQALFTLVAQCHRVLLPLTSDLRRWRGAAALHGCCCAAEIKQKHEKKRSSLLPVYNPDVQKLIHISTVMQATGLPRFKRDIKGSAV